jgi:hypothetical protein
MEPAIRLRRQRVLDERNRVGHMVPALDWNLVFGTFLELGALSLGLELPFSFSQAMKHDNPAPVKVLRVLANFAKLSGVISTSTMTC